ncbi:actin-binding protein WASF2-like isoform X2 [Cylas formicarius]|uniref:actin-binding protein WASF2-like isoform X2 n=1 Tax=Cylas formicarius TaxID=197179 RepID=UPI002958D7B1|nr:actin-binding protein WASF2-like isoform X2 [Cylas formicarius]
MLKYVTVLAIVAATFAQDFDFSPLQLPPRPAPPKVKPNYSGPSSAPRPTPVPILKQIDRHNEDGSYTYGYESADGSFKIETKLPTGEVKGKYGYVDDVGKIRVIEYGATKYGFEPAGEGITVAPPTLVDETTDKNGNLLPEYADNGDEPAPPRPSHTINNQYSQGRLTQTANSFEFTGPQSFQASPARSSAPVPPRANIPGAVPVQSFAPAPRPAPRPAPVYNAQPAPFDDFGGFSRPSPKLTFVQPAAPPPPPSPQYAPRPAPRPAPAPQYSPFGGNSESIAVLNLTF